MIRRSLAMPKPQSALTRLSALAPLDDRAVAALSDAIAQAQPVRARRELMAEGNAIDHAKLIVSGWAARMRLLPDGRRQLLSFLLPGDLVGLCEQPAPLAVSTVVALTDVTACAAPPAAVSPTLAQAYATSRALDEGYLLAQIVRLGRYTAQERIGDLLLELLERLQLAGLASQGSFDLPLTQETLADALGLTSVHVNRMLQLARKQDSLHWKNSRLTLPDPGRLAQEVGRVAVRVSGEPIRHAFDVRP